MLFLINKIKRKYRKEIEKYNSIEILINSMSEWVNLTHSNFLFFYRYLNFVLY